MKTGKNELICMGISAVDLLVSGMEKEAVGTDYISEEIRMSPGGDALNQAMAAAKLGCSTGLITAVGNDWFGTYLEDYLQKHTMIDTIALTRKECGTSVSIVMVRKNGEHYFVKMSNGSVDVFAKEDIPMELITENTKILSIGSLGGSRELIGDSLVDFLKTIKKKGITIVADMVGNLGIESYEALKGALPYIDYFLPSEEEAVILLGEKSPEVTAEILMDLGVRHVAIKLGSKGAYIRDRNVKKYLPSYRVPVIDTTGAGDHFVAGFNAALLEGKEFEECIQYAMATAAVAIQYVGTASVKISDQDVHALMKTEMTNQK